jgi:hypothetical protein
MPARRLFAIKDDDEKYSTTEDILSAVAKRPIIRFYSGAQPDHRGRYRNEIQGSPDAQLESIHDHIQWLFPLSERSGFNVAAPVLPTNQYMSSERGSSYRGNCEPLSSAR